MSESPLFSKWYVFTVCQYKYSINRRGFKPATNTLPLTLGLVCLFKSKSALIAPPLLSYMTLASEYIIRDWLYVYLNVCKAPCHVTVYFIQITAGDVM